MGDDEDGQERADELLFGSVGGFVKKLEYHAQSTHNA
jgi:hypothetical protein